MSVIPQKQYKLSARAAGNVLGKSRANVVQLILKGDLPAILTGGVYRISEDDLRDYVQRSLVVPRPPVVASSTPEQEWYDSQPEQEQNWSAEEPPV